jgi:drug/metabolite transporter (DMT)-like permease
VNIFIFISFTALLFLNLFDIYSTKVLIEFGAKEANPYVNFLMNEFGIVNGMLIAKGIAFILLTLCCIMAIKKREKLKPREKKLIIVGFGTMIGYYSYFMYFYNYRMLISMAQ